MDEQEQCRAIKDLRARAKRITVNKSTRVKLIMAYECGEANEAEIVALFQDLVDTGMAWSLQGSYGRAAQAMIEAGLVTRG